MMIANLNTAESTEEMFKALAGALGGVISGDRFVLHDSPAHGLFIKRELGAGLSAFYFTRKTQLPEYLLLQKSDVQKFFVMFAYSKVPSQQTMHLQHGDIVVKKENLSWRHAFLVSSYEDMQLMLPPGFEWSNLLFIASKTWLDKNVENGFAGKLQTEYPLLRALAFDMLPIATATGLLRDQVAGLITDKAPLEDLLPLASKLLKDYFTSLRLILKGMQVAVPNEKAIAALVNYIQNQPESELISPVSRKELSRKLGMSESKLGTLFKSIYDTPYSQYIIGRRMEWAADKMTNNQMSVTDAGFALGYENLSQFSASFKKHLKLLPSELLKKNSHNGQ